MSKEPVIVLAMLKFKGPIPQSVLDYLPEVVAKTRAEDDCISNVPHLPLEGEPNRIYLHEIWTSKEALDGHLQAPYLARFRELAEPHLEGGIDVSLWKALM